jgi:flagellar biosynthesis protein FlhB
MSITHVSNQLTCVTGIVYIFSLQETTELIKSWLDTCVIDIVYIFSLHETTELIKSLLEAENINNVNHTCVYPNSD